MARSISTIQAQIIANIRSNATLNGLNSLSQTAIWRLLTWVVAVAINLLEQLWDIFTEEMEGIATQAITGSGAWLRQQVLNFQFGYIVTIDPVTFSPSYSTIDANAKIITRCSVTQSANFTVNVKIATGTTSLAPATTDQVNALTAYLDEIDFAGVGFTIINQNADLLYVKAQVYYNGQYTGVINNSVITALNNYCASLSSATNFNGIVDVLQIENAIQAVPGVTDVVLQEVWVRPYAVNGVTTTFGDSSTVKLVTSNAVMNRNTGTFAGYIVNEANPNDFASQLTFIIW